MKKNNENSPEKNSSFSAGEVMTMFEHVNENITVVAEEVGSIHKRLDGMEGRLDSLQEDITDIKFWAYQ